MLSARSSELIVVVSGAGALERKPIPPRRFTVTVTEAVLVHPFASVPTTEYSDVTNGMTMILEPVAPLLH